MTPEEQAPVRCAQVMADGSVCGEGPEFWEHMFANGHAFVPAPEETVETTEQWWVDSYCSKHDAYHLQHGEDGTSIVIADYASAEEVCRLLNVEPPAPEPAGEEDPLDGKGTQERCATCPNAWQDWKELVDRNMAISAEWKARAEAAEARIAELEHQAEVYRDTLAYAFRQVAEAGDAEEDAERKLEEMREGRDGVIAAVQVLLDMRERGDVGLEKYHMPWQQVEEAIERALTPPASTAQGDR